MRPPTQRPTSVRGAAAPPDHRAVLGPWVPGADGLTSELPPAADPGGSLIRLLGARTAAVWLDTEPGEPPPDGLGPPRFVLQACGTVRLGR